MPRTTNMLLLAATGGPPPEWDDYVLTQGQMSTMLQRERLRADRSGAVFSVVTIDAPLAAVDQILQTLRHRLRKTDVVGYAAPDLIGAFLPDTPASGAWNVVDDILALLPKQAQRPHCDVYVYPDASTPQQPSGSPIHANGNGKRNSAHGRVIGPREFDKGQASGRRASDSMSRAQALRTRFTEPLPHWKRGLDIAGALCGMVICSPVFVAAALAVRFSSRGPILFQQQRAGLGGRPFTMWKLRTMCVGADEQQHEIKHLNEQDGAAFKVTDDPRVTAIGRILRSTSVDELPQLWNVLRGDMSLVGPRPLPLHEAADCLTWQQRRLDVTPGLTCIWQAHGRSRVSFDEWMRMDLRYAQQRTLLGDLQLVFQTIPAVLKRRGAS